MKSLQCKFDDKRPCLVLAPHLEYPIRNGADILIDRKWSQFSNFVPFVDIIGKNKITRYRKGEIEVQSSYDNCDISKLNAAIWTVLNRSHYLLEKSMTGNFRDIAKIYFSNPEYNLVVFSYVWTATLIEELGINPDRLCCIETHNDELKWFDELRKSFINPAAKLAAIVSKRWLVLFLKKHELDFIFFHLSQADYDGYLNYFPKHIGDVVPVGVEMPEKVYKVRSLKEHVRLIFAGSLSGKMNFNALKIFRYEFYSVLKNTFGEKLEIIVVGSNPSKAVRKICAQMGWELHRNVSDDEMARLYGGAMFSLLPFHCISGEKLKLLETMANGVPFLATTEMEGQVGKVIYPCLLSDDPNEWLKRIVEVRSNGIDNYARSKLISHAKKYSWPEISHKMYKILKSGLGVTQASQLV